MLFGVDAGGTKTTVVTESVSGVTRRLRLPSISPAAVGHAKAAATLLELFVWLSRHRDESEVVGCVGSAAFTADTADDVANSIRGAAENAGFTGRVLMLEDISATLLGPPLLGAGVACIVGTGVIAVALGHDGTIVQCGGYEYLISDEGGGWDLGMQGLRAAAKAFDGRGPATALLDLATARYGDDIPALGMSLALEPFPKSAVARFARDVCEAAVAGDVVAMGLLSDAVAAVASAIAGVWRRVDRRAECLVLTGALVVQSDFYQHALRDCLDALCPGLRIEVIRDPCGQVLELARLERHDTLPAAVSGMTHLRITL
jgi:N-acetylglucosamine kinase-like BadF-type ATPase